MSWKGHALVLPYVHHLLHSSVSRVGSSVHRCATLALGILAEKGPCPRAVSGSRLPV